MTYLEHPQDVLAQWLAWHRSAGAALVVVTATQGGGVRAPGALMAVSASGERAGYISGGCIDADVKLHAVEALRSGRPATLRYGAGSPFLDLPLPCGGMIEVQILPKADAASIEACLDALAGRRPASLHLPAPDAGGPEITFRYEPKMRLRIAGRGADGLALARLAVATGIDVTLQLRDGEDVIEATRLGFAGVTALKTPGALPPMEDDPWTAFLLAFHDTDWETALLSQALAGPAFYIGAVGSRATHARRSEHLRAAGLAERQIGRVRGPVGLIASMRDASMLAVSVLSEIVQSFHERSRRRLSSTALVLLAAGQSSRFADGDKLLAQLEARPLLAHSAEVLAAEPVAGRIAVVGPGHDVRAKVLLAAGWTVVVNAAAATGLASSLAAGIAAAGAIPAADAAMVLLADMPHVPDAHLFALREALTPERSAVMSARGETLLPPAVFARHVFGDIAGLRGDAGARQVFASLADTTVVPLPRHAGVDVDTREDLEALRSLVRPSGEESNRIFTELANWEEILKDTSLGRPQPPTP